jgi:hypothetical protein
MDSIRSSSSGPACFSDNASPLEGTPSAGVPSANPATSSRADSNGGGNLVEKYVWREPPRPGVPPQGTGPHSGPSFSAATLALLGGTPPAPATTFTRTDGTAFATSTDGTPMYRQADGEWGQTRLGAAATAPTLASRGCAVTSMAMALSKLSGETLTPGALDAHLDTSAGYVGNALVWGAAGSATEKAFTVSKTTTWSLDSVTKELEAGRPVVLGVDYKEGGSGGTLGTDHWVCLTRKEGNLYFANDPATGDEVRFRVEAGALKQVAQGTEAIQGYKSSGEYTTFKAAGNS